MQLVSMFLIMDTSKRNIEWYIMCKPNIEQSENLEIILKRLTTMVNNWDLFAENTYSYRVQIMHNEPGFELKIDGFHFNANTGICENAFPDYLCTNDTYNLFISDMIQSWKQSVGNWRFDLGYFIGSPDEYKNSKQLYRNPLRLHACLYFRNYIIDVLNSNV